MSLVSGESGALTIVPSFSCSIWRCLRLTRTNEPFFPDLVFREDAFGFGYYGFAGMGWEMSGFGDDGGPGGRARSVGARPRMMEARLELDEKDGGGREVVGLLEEVQVS